MVLLTKFHIPTPAKNLVHRSVLFNKLNEGLRSKLILVSAPAGYGKTTLLSDWAIQNKITTAWYSINSRDNDPIEFLSFLIHSIQTTLPSIGESSIELLKSSQGASKDYAIELLINDLLQLKTNILLVLDDFHLIETKEIFDTISFLINNIPEQFHIAISTRSDPPLKLARLRSRNELVEIRANDLSFSVQDISNFLNKKLKLGLSNDGVELLKKKTEGWIAGIQLTAISMQGRENNSEYLKELKGDNRYIMDYLIEEVLNIQPEEVKEFLLKTSVLEMFSGSLCDAVLQRSGSQLVLESLEKRNMFIIPLDDERNWFRYHHLFADLLKHRLRISTDISIPEIHNQACLWFEKSEMFIYAIEHALEYGNLNKAMELLDVIIEGLWENGQYATIFKFGKVFPEDTICLNKRVGVYYSWTLITYGRSSDAEKLLNQIERGLQESPDYETDYDKDLLGKVYITYNLLYSLSGNTQEAFKYSELALEKLSDTSPTWNYWAYIAHGEALLCRFDLQKSSELFTHAVNISVQADNIYLTIISTIELAYNLKLEGKYKDSYKTCNDLLKKVDTLTSDSKSGIDTICSMFHSIIGFILIELNNNDEGLKHAERGYELSKKAHSISFLGYCALLYANTLFKIGEIDRAIQIIQEIEANKRMTQLIRGIAYSVKIKLHIFNGDLDKASGLLNNSIIRQDIINEYESIFFKISEARLLIAQFKTKEALAIIDDQIPTLKLRNALELLIEAELMKAKAYYYQNEKGKAISSVIAAILLAQEEGFIRSFLTEGEEIETLINELLIERKTKTSDSLELLSPNYLDKLKSAYESDKNKKHTYHDILLSNRELDTLQLLAENLSNQETADKLYISLNTVKTHVKNILFKLEVDNRANAVAKAKELKII